MYTIGIIDDRLDFRTSARKRIEFELEQQEIQWKVLDIEPLPSVKDYAAWIYENDIVVLLVDEKLNEVLIDAKESVSYEGHDLVSELRKSYKELPIFILTAHDDATELEENAGDYDSIVKKDSFNKKSSEYVKRFIRQTNKYLEINGKDLDELSKLSEKIALGTADKTEILQTEILQSKLEIPFTARFLSNREGVIEELGNEVANLESLSKKIENFLKDQ